MAARARSTAVGQRTAIRSSTYATLSCAPASGWSGRRRLPSGAALPLTVPVASTFRTARAASRAQLRSINRRIRDAVNDGMRPYVPSQLRRPGVSSASGSPLTSTTFCTIATAARRITPTCARGIARALVVTFLLLSAACSSTSVNSENGAGTGGVAASGNAGGSGTGGAAGFGGEPGLDASSGSGGVGADAGPSDASDSEAGACSLAAALAQSLPSTFVWTPKFSACTGTNYLVQCKNDPCGTCTVTWGTPAFGADVLVPYSASCTNVAGRACNACQLPSQASCSFTVTTSGVATLKVNASSPGQWKAASPSLAGSWSGSGCCYLELLSSEFTQALNPLLAKAVTGAAIACSK